MYRIDMSQLQQLPLGIQDFDKLISNNYLYVDKTKYLHRLITEGSVYFLSRPRRFGKSLLLSTLEAIFLNKKKLFKGLWLAEESDYSWQEYPVIRLDMGSIDSVNVASFIEGLNINLQLIADKYDCKLEGGISPQNNLKVLINRLCKIGKIVVLVDEYDKPLLDNILDLEYAQKIRDILRGFYGILKSEDANLKFAFVTGVTKFSKTSIFSGLNNLTDISMMDNYAAMLGITEAEIDKYLVAYVKNMANNLHLSYENMRVSLREWYNGYHMSKRDESVYNPFSLLSALNAEDLDAYWFRTGTTSFLFKVIQQYKFDVAKLEYMRGRDSDFAVFDMERISLLPLLHQTGYLTIDDYEARRMLYYFRYPNKEVAKSFSECLLKSFYAPDISMSDYVIEFGDALVAHDFDTAIKIFNKVLKLMPDDLYMREEKYFHGLFFLILKLVGFDISAEVHTHRGRLDILINAEQDIYIFEFKYNKTAAEAIQQIKDKQYYSAYENQGKQIHLFGVNFDGQTRLIDDWQYEKF